MVQRMHHRIFLIDALVKALQRFQPVHVNRSETVELHRTNIAARALDPKNERFHPGQRIAFLDLGRGVTAAEICDPQIAAQQVGAVKQLFRLAECGNLLIIPKAFKLIDRHSLFLRAAFVVVLQSQSPISAHCQSKTINISHIALHNAYF